MLGLLISKANSWWSDTLLIYRAWSVSQEVIWVELTLVLLVLLVILLARESADMISLLKLLEVLAHGWVLEELLGFASFIGISLFHLSHHESLLCALRLINQMLFVLSD